MSNGRLSIGDDTPRGEPEKGPRGPYITDKNDGTQKPECTTEDGNRQRPADDELPTRTETEITKRSELGSDR